MCESCGLCIAKKRVRIPSLSRSWQQASCPSFAELQNSPSRLTQIEANFKKAIEVQFLVWNRGVHARALGA